MAGSGRLVEDRILPYLKEHLPPKRLGHVVGVAFLAQKIARKHGIDPFRAKLAGLLHDLAKFWEPSRLVGYSLKHKVRAPDMKAMMQSPGLLHGYVGARLARTLFGVKDSEVLSAIAKHTLGAPDMTALEKCVYVADLAAPDRKFPEAAKLRQTALKDLDRAFFEGVRVKLEMVLKSGERIHPESLRAWNSLAKKS